MRILVWQWGRHGAGPRFAIDLARGLAGLENTEALLSLSTRAEIMRISPPPDLALPMATYGSAAGLAGRLLASPFTGRQLGRRLAALGIDAAICAMPAALDFTLARALRHARIPYAVVVHDADAHPGDGLSWPLVQTLQRRLIGGANACVALSTHVAERLARQGRCHGPILRGRHPPFAFGPTPPPPRAHGGRLRLLSFGRLLPYKGLDLLAEALRQLGPVDWLEVRVVGSGPESADLAALRALPHLSVENRWVAEGEIAELLAWADALVLSHREASQSGVAAAALAAGRFVVATNVGGLAEQLADTRLALLCPPTPEGLAAALRALPSLPPAPPVAAAVGWHDLAATIRAALAKDVGHA